MGICAPRCESEVQEALLYLMPFIYPYKVTLDADRMTMFLPKLFWFFSLSDCMALTFLADKTDLYLPQHYDSANSSLRLIRSRFTPAELPPALNSYLWCRWRRNIFIYTVISATKFEGGNEPLISKHDVEIYFSPYAYGRGLPAPNLRLYLNEWKISSTPVTKILQCEDGAVALQTPGCALEFKNCIFNLTMNKDLPRSSNSFLTSFLHFSMPNLPFPSQLVSLEAKMGIFFVLQRTEFWILISHFRTALSAPFLRSITNLSIFPRHLSKYSIRHP